jgi:alpha-galactosidase
MAERVRASRATAYCSRAILSPVLSPPKRVAGATPCANPGPRQRPLRLAGVLALACLAVGVGGLGLGVRGASAQAGSGGAAPAGRDSGGILAAVPYMGWNTYYGVGGIFDEATILSVARTLLHRGLARAGYRIVWLDFGWASGARAAGGQLIVDPRQWPHGLRWLTDWLHRHHLLAGIYTDAGRSGCHGQGVGSLGHYQQDADSFAAWGFDAVKVDFCGAGQEGFDPKPLYTRFARALAHNSSHRRLLLNVCNFWVPGQIDGTRPSYANSAYATYRWASRIAQSWRTDTDIGFTGDIQWVNVPRNLDHDAAHPGAAGPGHWNDPDYLGPELGMTGSQARAQLSMWAIVAAPLILGSDPRKLSPATIAMLLNREVIAIDQDPLGIQGRVVAENGSAQVWSKPLAGGGAAVALLNRGSAPLRISTSASRVGLAAAKTYALRNVWAHKTATSPGTISAVVAPDSVVLYRARPA